MQLDSNKRSRGQQWLLASSFYVFVFIGVVFILTGQTETSAKVPSSVHYIEESPGLDSLEAIKRLAITDMKSTSPDVTLGITNRPHWFVVSLPTSTSDIDNYYLEFRFSLTNQIDIWFYDDSQSQTPIEKVLIGQSFPFEQRPVQSESFIIPLPSNPDGEIVAVMRVQGNLIKVPMQVWEQTPLFDQLMSRQMVHGMAFGVLLAMALINVFFFLSTKDVAFLYYGGYVLFASITLATFMGLGFKYLWPNNIWLQERAFQIFASLTSVFAMLFCHALFKLDQYHNMASKVVIASTWLAVLSTLLSFVLPVVPSIFTYLTMLSLTMLCLVGICYWLLRKGVVLARYYTLSWCVMMMSAFILQLNGMGVINTPLDESGLVLYGVLAETLLLSFVLAINYGQQMKKLRISQIKALENERETIKAKDKLLEVEQKAKDDLEYKVNERTLELEISLRELSEVNNKLERLSSTDALTGVNNRAYFDNRLVAEAKRSRREQSDLALAVLDIDKFKYINDTFGHEVGDRCIVHVAHIAQNNLHRSSDDICRYGGDEFVFILPSTDAAGATFLLEKIRADVENTPFMLGDKRIPITVSVGIGGAVIQNDGDEKELFNKADRGLYKAKKLGRNKVAMVEEY